MTLAGLEVAEQCPLWVIFDGFNRDCVGGLMSASAGKRPTGACLEALRRTRSL